MEIELPQIIFQMINFGVVLFVLNRFLYRPVLKMLEERRQKVEAAAKAAEETLKEKSSLDERKEEILKKAKKEAAGILAQAKADAAEMLRDTESQAKADQEARRSKFDADLKSMKAAAIKDQAKEIKAAALLIAEKVIGSELDSKKQSKLIDQELDTIVESL
jgi:F-type H+-transporting ATPase subunit b